MSRRGLRSRYGFTLIEILVVMLICTLLISLVPLGISKTTKKYQSKILVNEVVTLLANARNYSKKHNHSVTVTLEKDYLVSEYVTGNKSRANIPKNSSLILQSLDKKKVNTITFFPNGYSSGASIQIIATNRIQVISVSGLSGKISVTEQEFK
jgi:general secretion pathway protein H